MIDDSNELNSVVFSINDFPNRGSTNSYPQGYYQITKFYQQQMKSIWATQVSACHYLIDRNSFAKLKYALSSMQSSHFMHRHFHFSYLYCNFPIWAKLLLLLCNTSGRRKSAVGFSWFTFRSCTNHKPNRFTQTHSHSYTVANCMHA